MSTVISTPRQTIAPPLSTIGILGGGQLGRMTAMAAARLGYKCHIFCPETDAPALKVAATHTQGDFSDKAALRRFAEAVDVITLEWENVPTETLDFLAALKPTRPNANVLRIAQHRVAEKEFARTNGIGTADFKAIGSLDDLRKSLDVFPLPAVLKSTRMGYDGKGQAKISTIAEAEAAWQAMGADAGILEAFVPFEREISVVVARGADGKMAAYPAAENIHRDHILFETRYPARISPEVEAEAQAVARKLAEKLDAVGLLAVEMFVLSQPDKQGRMVLMNEIAPRPHNSGHWTIDACRCSQFEQLVRAVCGLPLGDPTPHSKAVMRNLLGDEAAAWPSLLQDPSACLHLYGKTESRKGRKMGHVTYIGDKV